MNNIHDYAIVHHNVQLGDNITIGAYCVIGTEAEIRGGTGVEGRVIIGDNTVIREHVTIHSSRDQDGNTIIGKNCFIQVHSHIGHDAHLSDNVTVAAYACVGGHVRLHEYVNQGVHSTTHQRATIYKGTILGANSFAKGVLESWGVYVGSPAKWIKSNDWLIEKLNKMNDEDN